MLKIGLTGGIGSGKSTVGEVFRALGIPVYIADDAARKLMQENDVLITKITGLLGQEAYAGGSLNRSYIAGIVFKDKGKLEALNALVHPFVNEDFITWAEAQDHAPYLMKEAAILFESGAAKQMDFTVFVSASMETRIGRVMNRDGVTSDQVRSRIGNQMDDETKEKLADFVINNEIGSMILPQIVDLHNHFLKLAENHGKIC